MSLLLILIVKIKKINIWKIQATPKKEQWHLHIWAHPLTTPERRAAGGATRAPRPDTFCKGVSSPDTHRGDRLRRRRRAAPLAGRASALGRRRRAPFVPYEFVLSLAFLLGHKAVLWASKNFGTNAAKLTWPMVSAFGIAGGCRSWNAGTAAPRPSHPDRRPPAGGPCGPSALLPAEANSSAPDVILRNIEFTCLCSFYQNIFLRWEA